MKDDILDLPNHMTEEDRKIVWELMNKFNWSMFNKLLVASAGLYGVDYTEMDKADRDRRHSEARYMYWYAINRIMGETHKKIAKIVNLDIALVSYGINKFSELLKSDRTVRERYATLMTIVDYGYKRGL